MAPGRPHRHPRRPGTGGETEAGVTVGAGDALLVHTGLTARLAATTPDDPGRRAGLGVDAVLRLRERDVAVFGGDCVDLLPGPDPDLPLPLHQLGIGAMGLTLLDWPHLDGVVALCAQLGRREFCSPSRRCRSSAAPAHR